MQLSYVDLYKSTCTPDRLTNWSIDAQFKLLYGSDIKQRIYYDKGIFQKIRPKEQ